MDTKQQSSGHQTAVLEQTTRTPRTDTETVVDSQPIGYRTERPTGHRRPIGFALAAIVLAGAGGLFAFRAVDGSSEPTGPADTSHETVEHQRHLSVKPATNGSVLDSFDLADYVWRQRQAGEEGQAQDPDVGSQVQFDPGLPWPPNPGPPGPPNQSAPEQQLSTYPTIDPETEFAGIPAPRWQPNLPAENTYPTIDPETEFAGFPAPRWQPSYGRLVPALGAVLVSGIR